MRKPLVEVSGLTKQFRLGKGLLRELRFAHGRLFREIQYVYAVNDISFRIERGEVFSIVGESGCGKSTAARTVTRLLEPDAGSINFDGVNITKLNQQELQPFRSRMQMVFQNPYASLNPRHTIKQIVTEPILFHKQAETAKEAEQKAINLIQKVGLSPEQADRYPHQFSGGQRQRISIARALAVNPEFMIADEPVSALDVSIQAQILNLMLDLKDEFNLAYLFISHDLAVVKQISDKVAVMYLGSIVEVGDKRNIFRNPLHPYTKALFASVPVLGRRKAQEEGLAGDIPPAPTLLPQGCFFYSRCRDARDMCREIPPNMIEYEPNHKAACHMIGFGG